jgi:hypothetical protein
MNNHTPMMAFWIPRDDIPLNEFGQNVQGKTLFTTLCGTNTLEVKERHNDDDDNDTKRLYESESMNRGTIWTITLVIILDYKCKI